ncbi:scavenger receptor cysteine-rich domain superfamily protein-like isoform X1 [Lytechinus variegatus]|uniref:scavenger receptor cysteine-rich domain superfamily protein-like isoform X1 n=1 Tax=Lytechinus variegatus TaxID=7654 RepID=UPI001BB10465|nr:scavenger receptor cysteine-rich domain superfamily protein-like isoform X1 [Lytechinus variegatus]XP_041483703.1 scavenger receptor cysteine-rich domain superfamily protein-like isoform X1 [Lytechinus variegatus]XP_041483704.1 scavenger receptor cysteine-rich domain superfamily protein-like isoform X1 [Lytechinus variegatus]XP_041483705.1 scavenger receptor cysteine-rich domain superfamily protein-like isoform X1 [Lytechinus variegatus]XP_041483706.1 scavenger receptor cysteine-rich domain 
MELRYCIAVLTAFLSIIHFAVAVNEDGDVRLRDGHKPGEGRVEVFYQGEWGTLCDDGFDLADANVICRQLGYSSANRSHCCAHFTHGEGPILLDDLACSGLESRISECPNRGWAEHNCAHTEDASVTCNGNIRLRGTNSTIQGRVEVFRNSNWGSVCNTGWDLVDGDLVCKQLGFPGANATTSNVPLTPATGPVLFSEVGCTSEDDMFLNCSMNSTPGPECTNHTNDATVICKKPIKLMGGSNPMEGYVAVYDGYRWGPICAKNWGIDDARVVCKQIGDLAVVEAVNGMMFGNSDASYLASSVGCTGTEATLDECPSTNTGDADCFRFTPTDENPTLLNATSNLAGVRCAPAVRLVSNDFSFLHGKVEVFMNGQWGGVCADQWGPQDAKVVCRQLGQYPLANDSCCEPSQDSVQNPSLYNLMCTGNEERLQDCPIATGSSPPTSCKAATAKCQVTVRLSGGGHDLEGSVEISRGGQWGNICDDNWGIEEAKVICRQLGNYEVESHSVGSKYGPPSFSYLLDDVGCEGNEVRVEDCYHSDWGTHNCGTSEAAGVSCRNLRLISDNHNSSVPKGRVEVVHNGRWGRVCGDNWDRADANVLCRQLYNSTADGVGSFAPGTGVAFMTNFQCRGNETSLTQCTHEEREINDCQADATVICKGGLRLVGGKSPLEGRVEIFYDGQWGTICDDGWDINDARVVCRQLGGYATIAAKCCQAYGPGTGQILMDGVSCEGTEPNLESCPHEGWQSHNCQHYEDSSAICSDIRLTAPNGTESTNTLEGRVEVLLDGQWKAICPKGWDMHAAQVVCSQLYDTDAKSATLVPAKPNQDTGLTNLRCLGTEKMFTDCPSQTSNVVCPYTTRAAVQCKNHRDKDIRLIGGSVPSEGAVEVLVDGDWGLICGYDWGTEEGRVTCRQLGYCGLISTRRGWEPKIEERTTMHWHSMNCTGKEDRLRDCQKSWGSFPCASYNFEAAVTCKNWCDPPHYLQYGTWSPRRQQYGLHSKISFTCDDGYELDGVSFMECLGVCEWSAGIPTCKPSKTGGTPIPQPQQASGIHPAGVFFIGLIVGVIVVAIAFGFIWYIRQRPTRPASPSRAGNIFRPRKQLDEMEEPVLSFQAMNVDNEENGDAI